MPPRRRASSRRSQQVAPPGTAPELFQAVLNSGPAIDAIFQALDTLQDRVALASTCTTLRKHAYDFQELQPATYGGDPVAQLDPAREDKNDLVQLWPNVALREAQSKVFMDKIEWLTRLQQWPPSTVPSTVGARVLRLRVDMNVAQTAYTTFPKLMRVCQSLIAADITLPSTYGRPIGGSDLALSLRWLRVDASWWPALNLAPLTALTSLITTGTVLRSLPPSLRRLDCEMWSDVGTSKSEAFLQPQALEYLRVRKPDDTNYVWVVGGEGEGVSSGEGLDKLLSHVTSLEIDRLLPLDTQFFKALPSTLRSLRLPSLFHCTGLVSDGISGLTERCPDLNLIAVSPASNEPPVGVLEGALNNATWRWSATQKINAALALLSNFKLEHLEISTLMDCRLPSAQRASLAALPTLDNLCAFEVSPGSFRGFQLLLKKLTNLESLLLRWKPSYNGFDSFNSKLLTAVAELPKLNAVYGSRYGAAPCNIVKYFMNHVHGKPLEGLRPKVKAAIETVRERGVEMRGERGCELEEWERAFPTWDKVEVGQHGEETRCFDLDVLSSEGRRTWRAKNSGPQT